MSDRLKTTWILVILIFILTFAAYLGSLCSDYETMASYLPVASTIEGSGDENDISHPLWVPVGRLVFLAAHAMGLPWSGLFVMKFISALAGAASCSLFFLLLFSLLDDWIFSGLISLLAGFSYIQWFVATSEKNYSLSALFLIPAFYVLLKAAKGDLKKLPALGLLHALSVTAHISNVLFFVPAATVLVLGAGSLRRKLTSVFIYSAIFLTGTLLLMDLFLFISPFRNIAASSSYMVSSFQYMTHAIAAGQYQRISFDFYLSRIFNWILLCAPSLGVWPFLGSFFLACALAAFIGFLVYRKSFKHLFLALAGAAIWGGIYIVSMIRVAQSNIYDNLNIYIILFPFWILAGVFLSTQCRALIEKFSSRYLKALCPFLLLILLIYSFAANRYFYFIPRHDGFSNSLGAVVKFYEKELRSDDLVITTRDYADYFEYFSKCRAINVVFPTKLAASNKERSEYILQLPDEYLGAGRRVIWHQVEAVRGTQTLETMGKRIDVSEDEYKNISAFMRKEILKKWLLIPYKRFSPENEMFLLKPRHE